MVHMGKESIKRSEEIGLGDTVRFDEPYSVTEGDGGTYTHGIVVEMFGQQRDDDDANGVSVHPYNPSTRSLDIRSQSSFGGAGVPEHVDIPADKLTLIHKASASAGEVKNEDGDNNTIDENIPDERALWTALVPHLNELDEQEAITSPKYVKERFDGPAAVKFAPQSPNESDERVTTLLRVARRIGWEVVETPEDGDGDDDRYVLMIPEQRRFYEASPVS